MSHLKHYEHTGTARFITLSCYHNYNLFKTDQTKEIFITNLVAGGRPRLPAILIWS